MTVLRNLLTLATGITVLSATSALAATSTGNLTVNATVNGSCTIGNATLNFGTYTTALGAATTASVNVNCTLLTAYTLAMGQGQNYDATAGNRMKSTNTTTGMVSHYIPYTATFPTGTLPTGLGLGIAIPTIIIGNAPAGANVTADTYSDSVIMTLTF
ncbi:spore coat protein U domain-containing protein [Deinococcus altitudinis]|uniref:spore coat protein U domain-containing protein n=1 Tax=Deinococcus altitudinis TaxID=468914 RepID=UPI0038923261